METACNRHTDVALSPEGLGTRLAQMALHYALMLGASTALVGIPDCNIHAHYQMIWGGGGGLLVAGTDGPGGPFIPDMDGPG